MDKARTDAVVERWRREVRAAIPSADLEVAEEIAQYLAERWLRACAAGTDPAVADADARADLLEWRGRTVPRRDPPWYRQAFWSGWGGDLRFAARALRVRPLFSVGAVLLSAIAVTAAVAAFAVVYGILWRPLPYPEADRLAVIWQVTRGEEVQVSYPDYADVTSTPIFDARAAMMGGRGSLRVGDRIERVNALSVEAPGLAMLGARPHVGRLLNAGDADKPVAMVSYRLWTTHLNANPAIVGRLIWLSGTEYTVVGVLEPRFDFELPVPPSFKLEDNEIWTILDTRSSVRERRDVSTYEVLVRIAGGRTVVDAQSAVDAIAGRLAREQPATNADRTFRVGSLKEEVIGGARRPMLFVALAAVATLLVAAANLLILGLVRGSERQAELSIRDALGAGAFRIRRQLFTEHLLIAACGATCGFALAREIVRSVVRSEAAHLPRADAVRFDAPMWWVAGAVTLLMAVTLTVQPLGLRAAALRSGARMVGRSVRSSRRLLVATEIALALSLATGGALLALSFSRLLAIDPGFDPGGAAAARISAYAARYPERAEVIRLFDDVVMRMKGLPQVSDAGAGSTLPLSGQATGTSVVAEGAPVLPGSRPTAGWAIVTPGYFDAVGMQLRTGRDFSEADRHHVPHVTVINETLARMLFPGEHPVGRRIGVGGGDAQNDWHEIIGVVADVRHQALDTAPAPRVYDLVGQHWTRTMFVVARTGSADAAPLLEALRMGVGAVDPEAPVFEATTLTALVDRSASARRLASTLALGLAGAGVLLALIGVYAVSAASVAERAREIGVRAALGASPGDLFRLIAGEGVWTAIVGGAAGLLGSIMVVRLLQAHLFGVRPAEALWLVPLVSLAVLLAAGLAAVPPARRAASIDPLTAIRAE